MEKLCLLLLTLVALLHCRTSLAGGVANPPRPGECPRQLEVGPSRMRCKNDDDCPRWLKCRKFKCGSACVPPILTVCPPNPGPGPCAELCSADSDCPDPVLSKCCSNGCGHECTEPHIVKPGLCGRPRATFVCALEEPPCAHDGHCPGNQKCCWIPCGRACSEPY